MKNKINLIKFIQDYNDDFFKTSSNNQKEDKEFEKNDLTELFIHKTLYFSYGYFIAKFNKPLFDAKFEAWKYGPVEIDFRTSTKKNEDIFKIKKFDILLTDEEIDFLKKILSNLLSLSTWKIVELSHWTDPWKDAYDSNNDKKEISKEEIHKYFKKV